MRVIRYCAFDEKRKDFKYFENETRYQTFGRHSAQLLEFLLSKPNIQNGQKYRTLRLLQREGYFKSSNLL